MADSQTKISQDYDSYSDFKGWGAFDAAFYRGRSVYFDGEFRGHDIAGARILEIGHGSGYFLHWARQRGAEVVGVDINDEMFERLRGEGFQVILGDVLEHPDLAEQRFDYVVAFDVFEHLPLDYLKRLLAWCEAHLSPGGRLIAKFPNAQSPFSLIYQYGDVTHVTHLSVSTFSQLLLTTGLKMEGSGNAYRIVSGRFPEKLARRLIYAMRDLFELMLAYLYFSGARIPLDPNVTVRAVKR